MKGRTASALTANTGAGFLQSTPDESARTQEFSLGIVVPVYNEAKILEGALSRLQRFAETLPVVVVDGGSTDGSAQIARRFFPVQAHGEPNRGAQLNRGAQCLATDVLLFLHADSQLPPGFQQHIRRALLEPDVVGGCFCLAFDEPHPLLRFYSWFTRFSWRLFHFGDQGFFVRREVFQEMNGFRELPILEDVDFLRRLRLYDRFAVLPAAVTTSGRRFLRHGIVRQMLRDILLVALFELGFPAQRLTPFYPHSR